MVPDQNDPELAAFRRDRTGETYGWLTVLGPAVQRPKVDGVWCWLCRCRCGRTVEVRGRSLASGNTTSCGCKAAAKRSRGKATG